ncbi:hypothetical protein KP509_09G011900 [Ceratopteris richardii]|uniref:BHLH domain-containing protein n=1 Tax=Ceratopteris richardii TaxID=49495 RepID=A0A8T2U5D7_CERRI|nr:hypothetical protein KP509_09G011900 [Ceratopteris richardii]
MESYTGSDSTALGDAVFRTFFFDDHCQQPIPEENQMHMTYDFGPGSLSDNIIPTLYSSSVSDAALSLTENLPYQPWFSLHDLQKNSLFAQSMAQAYQFTDNHPITQSDDVISAPCAPLIPISSQDSIQNGEDGVVEALLSSVHCDPLIPISSQNSIPSGEDGIVEALLSSKFNRSHITHESSSHSDLLATSLMQYDALYNTCSQNLFTPVDRIAHRTGFIKPTESSQCSSFRKWGKHLPPTARSFRTEGAINSYSPKYVLRIRLPKLAEKMQQQALRSTRTGTSVVNSAGTQASSHWQAASVDVHRISSGNSSGNYHQQQKNETNDLTATSHMYAERRRRKRQRECFTKLRTLVPNIRKKDKVTVLEHAITFIKELQNKVDELETLISLKDELLAGNLGSL